MPLWGATDSDESKPKNLTTAQKKQVFANASGWVLEAGSALSGNNNTSATPEVLVAIGGLATSIGAADITEIEFVSTAFDKSDGGNIDMLVRFNEPVTVTGTPQFLITNKHHLLEISQQITCLDQVQTNLLSEKQLLLVTLQQMQVMFLRLWQIQFH